MRIAMNFLPWREPILIKGEGSLTRLPEFIKNEGVERVLVVTDAGLMELGLLEPLFLELKKVGIAYTVYDEVVPNPTIDNIEQALSLYLANDCKGVIAFGGGSPMDCAKATAARAAKPRQSIPQMKGALKVHKKLPPIYAVPTTAGTGSETTLAAVVTDSATSHKYAINDTSLIPHAAVLDPLLTVKLPKSITSTTGMDALCHAVEAYIGRSNTKKTRQYAREAVSLIFDNLYKAYENAEDIEARHNMQNASYLAGLAFTRAYVGYVHAIAHTIGGKYHVAHGLANAIIMPYVFKQFGSSVYKPLSELADLVGLSAQGDSLKDKSDRFIAAIESFNSRMNIGTKIPQIEDDDISQLADYAVAEGNPLYPVPRIFEKAEFEELFRRIKE